MKRHLSPTWSKSVVHVSGDVAALSLDTAVILIG
jgi:predicted FMN-binding regulatory protein PaiB